MSSPTTARRRSTAESPAQRTARITGWFTRHRAHHTTTTLDAVGRPVTIERLTWMRDNDNMYRIDFTCLGGGRLLVSGDLGVAVYEAGMASLEAWSSCEIGYFASKCVASPTGRGFAEWDGDVAKDRIDEIVAERREAGHDIPAQRVLDARLAASEGKVTWYLFLNTYGREIFGDHWTDYAPEIGVVIDGQCHAHLQALKLAVASLAAAPAVTA